MVHGYESVRLHIASYYTTLSLVLLVLILRRTNKFTKRSLDAYLSTRPLPLTGTRITTGGLLLTFAIAVNLGGSLGYFIDDQIDFYHTRAIAADDRSNGYLRLAAVGFTGHLTDVLLGLIILPISRTSVLSRSLHLSPGSLLNFHQWIGYVFFLTVLLHTVCFYAWVPNFAHAPDETELKDAFAIDNPTIKYSESVRRGPYSMSVLASGMLSFAIFVAIIITSLPGARRKRYNTFYVTHAFSILFFIFACMHASTDFYMLLPGLVLWLLDWWLRVRGLSTGTEAQLQAEGNGWYRIVVPLKSLSASTKRALERSDQYPLTSWYLNAPAISKWQVHPFTTARQAADPTQEMFSGSLVFLWRVPTIPRKDKKQAGEWTTRLTALVPETTGENVHAEISAQAHQYPSTTLQLRLEGPYPLSHRPFESYRHVVCIVGGTGITGALSLAEKFIELSRRSTIGSESRTEPILTSKMTIIWTLKEAEDAELTDVKEMLQKAQQAGTALEIRKHLTGPGRQRLDLVHCIETLAHRQEGEKGEAVGLNSTWVYFSGPSKFMEDGVSGCIAVRKTNPESAGGLSWYSARWDV